MTNKRKEQPPVDWKFVLFGGFLILFGFRMLHDPVVTFWGGAERVHPVKAYFDS